MPLLLVYCHNSFENGSSSSFLCDTQLSRGEEGGKGGGGGGEEKEGVEEGGEGERRRQSADSEGMGRRNVRIHGPRIQGMLE